jgi:hypothetical protein
MAVFIPLGVFMRAFRFLRGSGAIPVPASHQTGEDNDACADQPPPIVRWT